MLVLLIAKQKGFRKGKQYTVCDSDSTTWSILNHEGKPTKVSKQSCILVIPKADLPLRNYGEESQEALVYAFEQGYAVEYLVGEMEWELCTSKEDFLPHRVYRSMGVRTPKAKASDTKRTLQRIKELENEISTLKRNICKT